VSVKRILILLGIVLGVGILGVLAFVAWKAPQAQVEVKEKVNDALARSVKRQVIVATELYYDDKKTVPQKLTDLFSPSSYNNSPYFSQNSPGLNLIEYRYVDSKNADVCLVFDSPVEQKCQRFTGK